MKREGKPYDDSDPLWFKVIAYPWSWVCEIMQWITDLARR